MFTNRKSFIRCKIVGLTLLLGVLTFFGMGNVSAQPAGGEGITACNTGEQRNAAGICVLTNTLLETPKVGVDTKPTEAGSREDICKLNISMGLDKKWENGECKDCTAPGVCCGIKLNTTVPFIGNCIRTNSKNAKSQGDNIVVTDTNAFPILMGALTKIMTTIILLVCFGAILAGGVMIASSGGETARATDGKKLIGKAVIAIALLGASGIILHLINPNFFG